MKNVGDTYAAFGALFFKPDIDWEIAAGLRFDHEDRTANGSVVSATTTILGTATAGGIVPTAKIRRTNGSRSCRSPANGPPTLMTYRRSRAAIAAAASTPRPPDADV